MHLFAAPGAGHTHWKQTVFYFPDYASVKFDEVLEGKFFCKVNRENTVRTLDGRVKGCRGVCRLERTLVGLFI